MTRLRTLLLLGLFLGGLSNVGATPWGSKYFPNVELTTHDGEVVRFFDDLIKDRVVAINFIYTSCPDVCSLETAQLVRVQEILGDKLGDKVHFFSITIDPDTDTPERLTRYRSQYGARWTFLTGEERDIISLRRKLGLYIEDNPDPYNHNVSMIIGNQATGRWMKRSPFENPHVLADQLVNWLNGWRDVQTGGDYASAPTLRKLTNGEQLYRTRCMSCHTIDGSEDTRLGPDLLGVTDRRDRDWLVNWLKAPDKMLAEGDPLAIALYQQYNEVAMPNLHLTLVDVRDIILFLEEKTERALSAGQQNFMELRSDVLAVMNAWIRVPSVPDADVYAGYVTLINVTSDDATVVNVTSDTFGDVQLHEMVMEDGMMKMANTHHLMIPAGGQIVLKPGGKHLMLKNPNKRPANGDLVKMTLTFASGHQQQVSLPMLNK